MARTWFRSVLASLILITSAQAGDWPAFRGPDGNGILQRNERSRRVEQRQERPLEGRAARRRQRQPDRRRRRVFVTCAKTKARSAGSTASIATTASCFGRRSSTSARRCRRTRPTPTVRRRRPATASASSSGTARPACIATTWTARNCGSAKTSASSAISGATPRRRSSIRTWSFRIARRATKTFIAAFDLATGARQVARR